MTTSPLVSVIIPVYNAAPYIGQMLGSILAQSHPAIEIILVDDGSTDELDRALAPYQEKIAHFVRQNNQGISAARNRGIALAIGDYFLILDADDWLPDPHSIAEMVALLEEQPDLDGVAGGWISYYDAENQYKNQHWLDCPDLSPQIILEMMPIMICVTLFRREVVLAVGPFDTTWPQNEDGDWIVRLCLGGYHLAWLRKIVYVYRQEGQGISARKLEEQLDCQYRYWPAFVYGPHYPSYLHGKEKTFLYSKIKYFIRIAFEAGLDTYAWKFLALMKPQTQSDDLPLRVLMPLCLEFAYWLQTSDIQKKIIPYLCQQVGLSPNMTLKPSPLSLEALVMWWMGPWTHFMWGEEVRFDPSERPYLALSILIYPTLFYPQPEATLDLLAKLGGGKRSRWANLVFWRALYSRQWGILPALLRQCFLYQLPADFWFALRFQLTLRKR